MSRMRWRLSQFVLLAITQTKDTWNEKRDQKQKFLTQNIYSELKKVAAFRKSWKNSNISLSTLRRIMGYRSLKLCTMDSLNTHFLMKNLNLVFYCLKCAAKLNIALCVVPKLRRMAVVATIIRKKPTHRWKCPNTKLPYKIRKKQT